ncbi:MAG TPA: CPBP family intramembrane glutamic endopeptidase [Candidatus Omnitrophota bacterium]|nr:CPBP family intramembrane glutamic endopeptidase [Candidatus Omnitrophota bacterium]
MTAFFSEIKGFIQKEKSYIFLLVLIVFFYALAFTMHQAVKKSDLGSSLGLTEEELAIQKEKEEIKARLDEFSDDPQAVQDRLADHPKLSGLAQMFILLFTFFFGVGIALSLLDLRRWLITKEFIPGVHRTLAVTWGVSEIIKVVILFFGWSILLNIALAFLKLGFSQTIDASTLIMFHTLLLDVISIWIIASAIRKTGSQFQDLGFSRLLSRRLVFLAKEIWMGIRIYLSIFPILLGILFFLVFVASFFAYEPPPHPLAEMLLEKKVLSPWIVLLSVLVACVFGPIVEEVFFRGFFYPALKKYWGAGWTTVLTAALFALVHENIFAFLPIFFLGVVLCHLYERRRDLAACISLHMIHNTVFIAYFFLVKSILSSAGP